MNEKAVIYARYSSHNQTEQSIEGQIAAARRYAADHNYQIVNEYCDRAKTGTNDNREAFQRMLSDCHKKLFTVIIVWKVDRFGRNREEITFNKYQAKKNGVRVEYVAESISDGPEGVILESVLEGMAEYYSLQLSQNVKRGLLESAKKHRVMGGHATLGYRPGPDRTYEIDPETAPIVKLIFDKYQEGMPMKQLADWLNDQGYRTSKGSKFTKNSLPRILTNEKYMGVYTYKDIIREPNAIPKIVSEEQFIDVQKRISVNRRKPAHSWSYSDYLLTNKLYCIDCGSPMVGKSGYGRHGGKYQYYCCTNRLKKEGCEARHIRQDELETIVLDAAYDLIKDETTMNIIVDKIWDYYLKNDTDRSQLEAAELRLANINKSIERLVSAIEQGAPYEVIKPRMDSYTEERQKISEMKLKLELDSGLKLTRDMIVLFLEQFRLKRIGDRKCQIQLVETFVNSVYLADNYVLIAFNYSSNDKKISLEGVRTCLQEQSFANEMRTIVYGNVVLKKKRRP